MLVVIMLTFPQDFYYTKTSNDKYYKTIMVFLCIYTLLLLFKCTHTRDLVVGSAN